jgi:hypothetical protein
MYVFYNKNNLEILTIVNPNDTSFNIEEFKQTRIEYDTKYQGLTTDDIGCAIGASDEYDHLNKFGVSNKIVINPETRQFEINVCPKVAMDNKNLVYGIQPIKRMFSHEDIYNMYNRDYINVNLKNICTSGVFKVEYVYLKDLKMKTRVNEVRWESFFTDPFLKEMGKDKLILGRDIMKRGMYYPFTCIEDEEGLTVFDGQHRITSLKLLQFLGEIPDDFRVLCIFIPKADQGYKDGNLSRTVDYQVTTRSVFESKYGYEVVNDKMVRDKAIKSVLDRGGRMIDDFTLEWETNKVSEIVYGIHVYPLWVRDLIYPIQEIIVPNPVIYNEEEFIKWKQGV